jgi:hypothetical protein
MRYSSFDLERAKEMPMDVFRHPREVLCVVGATDRERAAILARWRELLEEDRRDHAKWRETLRSLEAALEELASLAKAARAQFG